MKRDDFYSLHIRSKTDLSNIVAFFAQYPRYQGRIKISVEEKFFTGETDSQILLESNLTITDTMDGANSFHNTSTANERSSLLMLVEYLAEHYTALPIANTGEKYSYYYASNELRLFNDSNTSGNTPVVVFKDKNVTILSPQEQNYYFAEENDERLMEIFNDYDRWYAGTFYLPAHKNTSYLKYVEYFLNDILSYESFNALKEKEILSESIESGNKNLSFRI